ncbi:MAG TPA: hypothetical protein VK196_11680 [Magnetospirillum sp.]|nr:hypothetical protein [Magnetospirillum sp.]
MGRSSGNSGGRSGGGGSPSKADLDNYSRQLDPEHDTYWQARGYDERPEDWQEKLEDE